MNYGLSKSAKIVFSKSKIDGIKKKSFKNINLGDYFL